MTFQCIFLKFPVQFLNICGTFLVKNTGVDLGEG